MGDSYRVRSTLSDLVQSISSTHKFDKEQLIFLNTSDIIRGEILNFSYSDVASMPGQAKKSIQRGDILLSEIRPANGRWAYINFDAEDYVVSTKLMVLRAEQTKIDSRFLYLFLTSSEVSSLLQEIAEYRSGTFPQITFDQVAELEIDLPSLSEQKAIVEVLQSLDTKIRVNQQIASTLEQIAQTIFKSWFVDFDPVHAKARGEQPVGMDADTAALFPDSFEDSELGPIPSGWTVKEIGKTLSLAGGSTPSTSNSDYWDGIYTWTTPKDLSNQVGLITVDSARKITEKGLAKITSGLLEKGSVLMSSRAPIGYLAISDVPTAINQGFIAFPFTKDFHPMFILNWLSSNMDEIKNRAGGSSFAEVSKSEFKTLPMLVPQSQLVHKFSEIAQPLLEQLSQITYQNRTLRDLRDSLLPRLISGELEIPVELLEA